MLVGKRNFNCLSCGIKDNAPSVGQPTANSTLHGTDGRLYRINNQGTMELTSEGGSVNATASKRYQGRVASAHPRNNRISELMRDGNESTNIAGSSVFNTTTAGGAKT